MNIFKLNDKYKQKNKQLKSLYAHYKSVTRNIKCNWL